MPDTATPTPTETATPTATPTPSPTPNLYIAMTTPAGEGAYALREVRVTEIVIILLLVALLVSIWGMYLSERLRSGQ